mgnify:CR=1 FL=1
MKKQGFNPYLPSWEYIPDGEPHVFDGRVYVFGSHDRFGGHTYCPNDYVCWSAPVDNLRLAAALVAVMATGCSAGRERTVPSTS